MGIILDENLTWKSHVSYVKKKLSKNIFILNKVKYVLDCKTMRMLYCSLILPYLSYCAKVWSNTYMSNIMPLFLLQKRAIRIIHEVKFGEHTNSLFIKSGLLKLTEIRELQMLLIMFKAKNRVLPENLLKLFVFTSEDGNHRRRFDFKHQVARTTLKQMCISVVGVKIWNSQQLQDLKGCTDTYRF